MTYSSIQVTFFNISWYALTLFHFLHFLFIYFFIFRCKDYFDLLRLILLWPSQGWVPWRSFECITMYYHVVSFALPLVLPYFYEKFISFSSLFSDATLFLIIHFSWNKFIFVPAGHTGWSKWEIRSILFLNLIWLILGWKIICWKPILCKRFPKLFLSPFVWAVVKKCFPRN